MTLAAEPILNHGPNVYAGWTEPAAPASRQEDRASYNRRILGEILSPILNSDDISMAFQEKWPAFRQWRDTVAEALATDTPQDLSAVLQREDAAEEKFRGVFDKASENLGQAIKPLLWGIRLRKIVRESVLPHLDSWPEDSYGIITRQMALNELCLAGVLYHLVAGAGREVNAHTLAVWSFKSVQEAYFEAGYNGKGRIPLNRPETE